MRKLTDAEFKDLHAALGLAINWRRVNLNPEYIELNSGLTNLPLPEKRLVAIADLIIATQGEVFLADPPPVMKSYLVVGTYSEDNQRWASEVQAFTPEEAEQKAVSGAGLEDEITVAGVILQPPGVILEVVA